MFKKGLFMLVALAIVAMTVMVPVASSAAEISDSLAFSVDFKDGIEDATGNYLFSEDASVEIGEEVLLENDDTLGRQVARFTGWGGLEYQNKNDDTLKNYDLAQGITLEAYVYLDDLGANSHNTVFIEAAFGALHLEQYDEGNDHSVGFRCGDVTVAGEGGDGGDSGYSMRNAYKDGTLESGKWIHLVGTSNGTVNQFYIDGELVAEVNRVASKLNTPGSAETNVLKIGESYFTNFGATQIEGKIAFARLYKAYADADTAKSLYTAATNGQSIEVPTPGSDEDSSTPTPTPTDGATEQPTDKPINSSDSSNNGGSSNNSGSSSNDGKTSNAKTFDLGIVSLAAVALSSAVAIKKKRK